MIYARHFGLTGEPFSLSPDPSFLYLSPGHAEALAALEVGLLGRRGLLVLTGEVGTGKTTLLYSLLSKLGAGIRTAYVANTKLAFDDMLRMALTDFGVAPANGSRVELLDTLNTFLRACGSEDATATLVVDEAQNLDDDTFENLRLLSNFETFTGKLLQIVLVGQPELEVKLQRANLRQVAERVAVRAHLNPLSSSESRKYLAYRLEQVGGSPDVFTPAARRLLISSSRGIPRRLNIIAHNTLLFAYGRRLSRATRRVVRAAVKERSGRGLVLLDRRSSTASRGSWLRPSLAAATLLAAAAAATGLWWRDANTPSARVPNDLLLVESAAAAKVSPVNHDAAAAPNAAPSGDDEPSAVGNVDVDDSSTAPSQAVAAAGGGSAVSASAGAPSIAVAPPPKVAERAPGEEQLPSPVVRASTEGRTTSTSERAATESGLRPVRVTSGVTLEALVKRVYGSASADLIARVRAVNPQITDPNRIINGDTLLFPSGAAPSSSVRP